MLHGYVKISRLTSVFHISFCFRGSIFAFSFFYFHLSVLLHQNFFYHLMKFMFTIDSSRKLMISMKRFKVCLMTCPSLKTTVGLKQRSWRNNNYLLLLKCQNWMNKFDYLVSINLFKLNNFSFIFKIFT